MADLTDSVLTTYSERASRITRSRSYDDRSYSRVFVSPTALAYADIDTRQVEQGVGTPHSIDFLQIFVITRGGGQHLSARGAVELELGSLVVLRPGTWTTFTDCDLEFASLGISPRALAEDLVFLRERPAVRDLLYSSAHVVKGVRVSRIDPDAAAEYAKHVARLGRVLQDRPGDLVLVLGELIATIGVAVAALEGSPEVTPMHPAVEATLERLESEIERPWRVSDLARAVNLDEKYLIKRFRAEVGVPPLTYLARLRVERAAALLADRELSITRVGEAVGWPDGAHFSRRFHDLMGVSPRQYRHDIRRDGIT